MNRRRPLLLVLALAGAPLTSAHADVPQKINDEGRLYDATTNAAVTGMHTMKFAIYSMSSGGTALWTQTSAVTFANGFYETTLDGSSGGSTPFPAGLFNGTELYLGVTVDTDAEMSPREPLDSVPNALYAGVAQNATGDITPRSVTVGGSVLTANGQLGIGTTSPAYSLDVPATGTVRLAGLQLFEKVGDNGTATCATYCEIHPAGGPLGACFGALDQVTGVYQDCNTLGAVQPCNIVRDSLLCFCVNAP
jgi:hypothetical protein